MTKAQKQAYFYQKMSEFGFSFEEANQLRKIELTLHRWAEAECNGEIQRTEFYACAECKQPLGASMEHGDALPCLEHPKASITTIPGPPRRYYGQHMDHSYPTADREAGALKRLAKIMSSHPEWLAYHQGDPRGCALYIISKERLGDRPIDSFYSQGFGVCF